MVGEAVPLDPQDTYYIRPYYRDMESKQLYLIRRNKHRESADMRRQRNMAQMKEQIKTPEKELKKMEISNVSEVEFKALVIRMLKELSEALNSIKKIQSLERYTSSQVANTRPSSQIRPSSLFYPAQHLVSTRRQCQAPCPYLRSSYIYSPKLHSAL